MVRTWVRSLIGAAAAITLMLALATQMVAAAFGNHPALGDPIVTVFGVKLYAPWNVLIWTAQWTLRDFGMAFAHAALVAMALLAALALAALMSAIEPTSFVIRPPRGCFERWAKLSQCGLLRGDGLALGAVRRLGLGRDHFVRCAHGHVLMLGDPAHTDDALIAAVSSWPGALVIIEARDVASRLGRADVMRFAPGRADGIAINPLLGVRGGAHAWSDAVALARAFLRTTDGMLVASFAALVLDTLAHRLPAARSFAGMRQALADPKLRLAELCKRWADGASDLGPASGELVRVVRHWRRDGEAALRMLRDIDIALRLFADGDHALATEGHHLRIADLVGADGPSTLVVQMPPGREKASAPLVSALFAQLVAACAPSLDLDQLGRIKRRDLLLVIEADALEALTTEASSSPAVQLPKKISPPLMDETLRLAHQRGLRVLVQARCISNAAALIRADGHSVDNVGVAFRAIAAIGPQTDVSARALAERAGSVEYWRRWPGETRTIARWLVPYWEHEAEWAVTPDALRAAPASDGLLLIDDLKPIRCGTLICDGGKSSFIDASALPHAPHDWDAPSLSPLSPPDKAAEQAALRTVQTEPAPSVAGPVSGAKLRRALARRSAPGLGSPSASSGDRLI